MLLRLLVLSLMLVFHGCTAEIGSSLLSKFESCDPEEQECESTDPTTISGELAILPDDGEIFASPEGSDLVEITGSCKDLGRKANRIMVQVFEGEDDSKQPIIDNSIGITCQNNISTSSLQSGISPCLIISQGIGLADTGNTTSQFPQCFNGRFSFQLRMGRIIRQDTSSTSNSDDTNPKTRYLVKMKLRTTDGITSDSGAATMFVNRSLAVPMFDVKPNKDNDRCEIIFNPSKFRDIRYTLSTTWSGPSYAASGSFTNTVSGNVYYEKQPTFPPLGDGTTIENFHHFGQPLDPLGTIGLMPGVTYTYQMQSSDYSWRNVTFPTFTDYEVQFGAPGVPASGAVERSPLSGKVSCQLGPADVRFRTENNQGTGTANSCLLTLAGANTRGYSIEWRVSASSPTWMTTTPNSGFLVSSTAGTDCRSLPTCFVHGDRDPAVFPGTSSATVYIDQNGAPQRFQANVPYYFAARHFRDTNGNGIVDDGEFVGEWSPSTPPANNPSDVNHRCTFNTFPVQ